MTKSLNQHFFDRLYRKQYYLWGLFLIGYRPYGNDGIHFTSGIEALTDMVIEDLECEYTKQSLPERSSYWVETGHAPILRKRLGELDLNKPKDKRRFPKNIPKKPLIHIIRGVFDAAGLPYIIRNEYNYTAINSYPPLLRGLNRTLHDCFDIKSRLNGRTLYLKHEDSIKLHNIMYQDKSFIMNQGYYLPFKKDRFKLNYVAGGSRDPRIIMADERLKEAKILLKTMSVTEVANELGYAHLGNFSAFFKRRTGMTPFEYKKSLLRR